MTDTTAATGGARANGLATLAADGRVLDTWYPTPELVDAPDGDGTTRLDSEVVRQSFGYDALGALGRDPIRYVEVVAVSTVIADLSTPPADAHDAYLRLHLLSHRLAQPNTLNLEGLFGKLNNVAWTSLGPVAPEELDEARVRARVAGKPLLVHSLDKFPRLLDYVVPSGVRIADAARVRLGAHLAEGTVVMPHGLVNFNAGTLGTCMVEGRIVQGAVLGDGSDLGGGASILGTLSGGGTQVVRIGERCLIGANGGIGISLGDDCVVEAGLYVTAGTRVTLPDGTICKALELSGRSGMLFRRNSTTGTVEVLPREGHGIELNAALHAN